MARTRRLWLGSLAAALVWLGCVVAGGPQARAEDARHRWAGYLPNVEVLDQDGRSLRFYDDVIKGKIVVFSFIYTSCLDICPLITARLAHVYENMGEAAGRDYHFVSISIDPERDTPERLKRHAEAFRSDPRWVFLTGTKQNIDLIRYKLGERSRKFTEHRSHVMLFNDRTGEWIRDSAFADLGVLEVTIRRLDPELRVQRIGLDAGTRTSGPVREQPGQALFAKACATCHTIGKGDRVGPDLDRVTERRERDWLERFIMSPQVMHAAGDPVAKELAERFPGVRMPRLHVSKTDVADLLAYIDARSFAVVAGDMKGPHAHATGIPAPGTPQIRKNGRTGGGAGGGGRHGGTHHH